MADLPPDDERTQGAPGEPPRTGWSGEPPTGPPGQESQTPATGWVVRQDPAPGDEPTQGAPDAPFTSWSRGVPPEESETPATGWMWAQPAPAGQEGGDGQTSGVASQDDAAHPDSAELTAATGWVIAGTVPPAAESSAAQSNPAPADPARASSAGWPQAPAISWAQAPMAPGTAGSAGWAAPPRRRRGSWWLGALAAAILAVLMVAGGGLGFAAASRPAPSSTPRSQPTLQPTIGPIGTVDSPLITLRLPAGWLEQQQSTTDLKLVRFPNGSMDISVQSASAVGASSPQAVLQAAQQRLSTSPDTVGPVGTCVQPVPHTIAGRPGLEQGFQFQERGADGKTLFTNCDVAWASVVNGEVYFWQVFDTLDQLKASMAAATTMQRSAHWQE